MKDDFDASIWEGYTILQVLEWIDEHDGITYLGRFTYDSFTAQGWNNYIKEKDFAVIYCKEKWGQDGRIMLITHIDIIMYNHHDRLYHNLCCESDDVLGGPTFEWAEGQSWPEERFENMLKGVMDKQILYQEDPSSYKVYVYEYPQQNMNPQPIWPFINWRDNPLIGGGA